jgi:hypothetical protein
MTLKLTAASHSDSKERQEIEAEPDRYQADADRANGVFSFGTFVELIMANVKLLLLGPAVAGLVAFGIASFLPKWYTSVSYLNLDESGARAVDARMRSTPVLDKVLAGFNPPQDTLEARRRAVEENRRIVVAAGDVQKTSNLFRLEYSDKNPLIAQKVNSLLIEAWLESTKPPPEKRSQIEAEIERIDTQTKSISALIDRLDKDAPSLVIQNSVQGELATPILGLITKRDQNLSTLINLRSLLNGVSRDAIFGNPDLPQEAIWPRRGLITVLTIVVTELLLFLFVVLRRFRPTWIQ